MYVLYFYYMDFFETYFTILEYLLFKEIIKHKKLFL